MNEHISETKRNESSSFVFRSEKPFHPDRLYHWMNDNWPHKILRSKGHMWIASRNDIAISISQAGYSLQIGCGGKWIATLNEEIQQELIQKDPVLKNMLKKR